MGIEARLIVMNGVVATPQGFLTSLNSLHTENLAVISHTKSEMITAFIFVISFFVRHKDSPSDLLELEGWGYL